MQFFKNKDKSFIAWVGTTLRPINVQEQELIYREGDDITESKLILTFNYLLFYLVYFLIHGIAGFVIPELDNTVFIKIEEGDHFGHTDIVQDNFFIEYQMSTKKKVLRNRDIIRRFTVQAIVSCELLILTIDDLERIKADFPDVFTELFETSFERLNFELSLREEAIELHEEGVRAQNLENNLEDNGGAAERND